MFGLPAGKIGTTAAIVVVAIEEIRGRASHETTGTAARNDKIIVPSLCPHLARELQGYRTSWNVLGSTGHRTSVRHTDQDPREGKWTMAG